MSLLFCYKREKLNSDFGNFLAKHVLRIGLPWQQLRSLVTKKYVYQMLWNLLTIKATKFQQSSANRFLTVAKRLPGGKFVPPFPPPQKKNKLGLITTGCPKECLTFIWCKLKTTVLTRFAFMFYEYSYVNLKFGIEQSKIGWKFAEQWLPKAKILERSDEQATRSFEKCTNLKQPYFFI